MISTSFDPLSDVQVVGTTWFNLSNGNKVRGYQHTVRDQVTAGSPNFQKGGGMGGLTLLAKAAPVEIGNRTWLDLDGDGVQDADEPAISGVTVELWKAEDLDPETGAPIAGRVALGSKVTDNGGNYVFRSQDASGGTNGFTADGEYVVIFKQGTGAVELRDPDGSAYTGSLSLTWNQLEFTTQEPADAEGQDTQRGSNANAQGNAPVTVGHAGQNDHSIDAGWRLGTVTVGNYVWEDRNHDGIQNDGADAGIEGVKLKIFLVEGENETELTTDAFGGAFTENRTDADGLYRFEKLPVLKTGQYYKVAIDDTDPDTIAALDGFESTLENVRGDGGNRGNDSSTGSATTVDADGDEVLNVPGRSDLTLDFGFFKPRPAATIVKNDGAGNEADTLGDAKDLTVPGGAAGTTALKFTIVNTGTEALRNVVVTDEITDGDAVVTDLVCTFPDGTTGNGLVVDGKLRVEWAETHGDNPTASFSNVPPANTFDCTATLSGVIGSHLNVATITGVGVVSGEDVPVNPFDPENPDEPGTDNPFHAKRTPAVSVGDRVWFDADGDGLQARDGQGAYTPEEYGINGVVLEILDPNGDPAVDVFGHLVPEVTTANGGIYTFENLPVIGEDEHYTVRIVSVPDRFKPTQVVDGGLGEWDSSEGEADSQRPLGTHAANDPTLDFGFVLKAPQATVIKSDGVNTADTAEDAVDVGPAGGESPIVISILNNGEEPITEVGLVDRLESGTGTVQYPFECTVTSADGDLDGTAFELEIDTFWNGSLPVGDSITCATTLTGVEPGGTHENIVTLWAEGSLTGKPIIDPVDPGDPENPNRPEDPFHAKYKTYAIGDLVWVDANGDGIFNEADGDEAFTDAPVKVNLYKLDGEGNRVGGVFKDTTTDQATGLYVFDELAAGQYEVEFELPTGYLWTTKPVTVSTPGVDNDSNALWTEEDQAWAATVGITLGDSNTALDPEYAAQDVAATEGIDPTWDAGIVKRSPNATIDKSDETGETANDGGTVVDLGPDGATGITFTIVNTGTEPLTGIGLADDTTSGSGEIQYPIILTVNGAGVGQLDSATSRWDGELARGATLVGTAQLTGVKAGESHRNEVTLHAEGSLTHQPVGTPEDPTEPPGPDNPVVPPTDEYNGRVPSYAIGDYVWIDADRDGVQDDSEQPLAGVKVNLLNADREPVLNADNEPITDTTDDNGFYLFDNLVEGTYIVEFELPSGGEYRWTAPKAGNDESTDDSDAAWTHSDDEKATTGFIVLGSSTPLTGLGDQDGRPFLATEGIDQRWDAGVVVKTYAIGDIVWIDRNQNGKQDDETLEPRLDGVTVNLYKAGENGQIAGDAIASTETDNGGLYLFDEVPAGDYIVEFVLPDGYRWTAANAADGENPAAGLDDTNDSDAEFVTNTDERARTKVITLGNDSVTTDYADQSVTATEGIDPTWDAGVVPQSVWVGDFVWHDTTPDGIQGDDEPGINDVTLTLKVQRADGGLEDVTDVYGAPVGPTTTASKEGKSGYYEFLDLPVLQDGEAYVVTIDEDSPVLAGYKPTKPGEGDDRSVDSSTGSATSAALTTDGANDPTLDFGFVTKVPGATVNKSDADGRDANTADDAVDLGPASGTTTIVFTIENDGEEPLTNIGLVDEVTNGDAVLNGPLECTVTGTGEEFTLDDADARWDGELALGDAITCEGTLTGVAVGQNSHTNVVTLWAEGTLTHKPVEDPNNPSGDPENPNRPEDPYNAEYLTYAIGDIVWIDRDQNGQQGDEKDLAYTGQDVTVKLYKANADGTPSGAALGEVTTDASGRYLFDGLAAGDYVVEFTRPNGYRFTEQNADGVHEGANSDASPANGRTGKITLGNDSVTTSYTDQEWTATEGVDPTWDAGIVPESVSVGDYVWFDTNGNGIQDEGENIGIAEGTTLTISGGPAGWDGKNVYGEPVTSVETGEDGYYEFTDLPVLGEGESYTVTISKVPARFKPTLPGQGDDRGKDSSTGSATSGPLTRDKANDPTLDFGFVLTQPGANVIKADEEGRDGNESHVDISSTDGTIGIEITIVNNGADEEPITNIALVDKTTEGSGTLQYPLVCTPTVDGEKGAEFQLSNSKDSIWKIGDEPGVLNVGDSIVCVGTLSGVVAHEPHTDVVTLHAEGALSHNPVGTPADPNKPYDPEDNPVTPPSDEYNAVVKTYAIGDYVWIDEADAEGVFNNVQDSGENGLEGVTVILLDGEGNPTGKTTTTDDKGYYQFDNLKPGTYQVQFELPRGYVLVAENAGDDDTVDSDALPISDTSRTKGRTITVTLDDTNGQLTAREGVNATEGIDPTWDAGVRLASVTVGDKVWKDVDRDGIQDPGEPGIPGVVLTIERSDGKPVKDVFGDDVPAQTTGEDGDYLFPNLPVLPDGVDYIVKIDQDESKDALKNLIPTKPGQGEDPAQDSSTWQEKTTGLDNDGDEDLTLDFGFVVQSVTVGDRVWEDADKNGRQDSGEPGIEGVVLTIVGPDGQPVTDVFGEPVGSQTTDEFGNYLFPNLPALEEGQSYTVSIDPEASADALKGFEPTKPGVGDRVLDSSTGSAESEGLTTDGDKDLTLDFGFIRPSVTVGDKVWKDTNRDGRQDPGEPGIPGVVLEVYGPDGEPAKDVFGNPVEPATTDKDGKYSFTDLPILPEGESYTVKINVDKSKDALGNLIPTTPGQGDREGDSSTDEAKSEGLTKDGDKDLTLDFGFVVPKVSVGDKVWKDTNRDGRQDPGEPGIPGVVLVIVGPDGKPVKDVYGNPVQPVATDKDGAYEFTNLPALPQGESYTVKIDIEKSKDALGNLVPTRSGVGNREGDSSTGEAKSEGLTKDGESDLTLDFGFVVPSVTVGDKVWLDKNANGRQDADERGISGVVLKIVGPDGKPVTDVYGKPVNPVATDKDGKYLFVNLPALPEGQSYKVLIDKGASYGALKGLVPTKDGVGDRTGDSSTWEALTQGLNADGDEDLTLDFGFVVEVKPGLPDNGALAQGAVWAALILVLGSGVIALVGSRRRRLS